MEEVAAWSVFTSKCLQQDQRLSEHEESLFGGGDGWVWVHQCPCKSPQRVLSAIEPIKAESHDTRTWKSIQMLANGQGLHALLPTTFISHYIVA